MIITVMCKSYPSWNSKVFTTSANHKGFKEWIGTTLQSAVEDVEELLIFFV